jgi:23S rRNA-/tRNA-specific pseudouridylate synthase
MILPPKTHKIFPLYAPPPYYRLHLIKPAFSSQTKKSLIDTLNSKPYRFNFTHERLIDLLSRQHIRVWSSSITSLYPISKYNVSQVDKIIKRKLNPSNVISYHQHIHENHVPIPPSLCILKSNHSKIIAIDKPCGIPVHGIQKYYYNTIHMILSNQLNIPIQSLYPIHRLDKQTSGVLLWTKDAETVSKFKDKENWEINKLYIARIKGKLQNNQCTDDLVYIYPTRNLINQYKNAMTKFTEVVYDPVKNESIIIAQLYRGYPHQIRIHLRNSGTPIIDDPLYGNYGKYKEIIKSKNDITPEYWNELLLRTQKIQDAKLENVDSNCFDCGIPIYKPSTELSDHAICLHSWKYTFKGVSGRKYEGEEYTFQTDTVPSWCVQDIQERVGINITL